jgi:hypothetical protein
MLARSFDLSIGGVRKLDGKDVAKPAEETYADCLGNLASQYPSVSASSAS